MFSNSSFSTEEFDDLSEFMRLKFSSEKMKENIILLCKTSQTPVFQKDIQFVRKQGIQHNLFFNLRITEKIQKVNVTFKIHANSLLLHSIFHINSINRNKELLNEFCFLCELFEFL